MYQPTLEQFKEYSKQGNLVPVHRVIMADLDTPVSAFMKLAQNDPYAFLLESVEQGEKLGRHSFIGFSPSRIFSCRDRKFTEIKDGKRVERALEKNKDPLDKLQKFMSQFHPAGADGLPPLFGGLVGYMSYEMTQHFERLSFENRDDFNLPDAVFYFADTLVIFDHFQRTMQVVANVLIDDSPETAYYEAIRRIDRIVKKLQTPLPQIPFGSGLPAPPPTKSNWEPEEFMKAVDQAKEHILAGDIFQVVIGSRIEAEITSTPLDIYRALRRVNPSPYTFYFRYEDACLIGGSPEILVKMTNNHVIYRPIAGTRKRGIEPEEDQFFERELINDPKERAEHIMLVDLGRNDIGRVCEFHTVNVTDLMYVERYSHVMHLVSTLSAN